MKVVEGRLLRDGRLQAAAIGIEDGKVVRVGRGLRGDEGHRDFGEALILPGGVDVHVHFREPGMTRKEDFHTGTTAAACGGITTVLDMPNTLPPTLDFRSFGEKFAAVEGKANVDFGLYAGLLKGHSPRGLEALASAYKVYLAETTGGLVVQGRAAVEELVGPVAVSGKVVSFHAEDQASLAPMEAEDLRGHLRARPPAAEVRALESLRGIPLPKGHMAHVTTPEGLELARGLGFSTEATPHHLLLDVGREGLGALGKVNPPLRSAADRGGLWKAFADGTIGVLASDHAPHSLEEKEEFATAPAGMPGVETLYALMLEQVRRGTLELSRLVEAIAAKPAAIFGLAAKGSLEVGKDADFIVADPRHRQRIKGEALHSRCGWTAFEGWEAIFPRAVFLRGEAIVEDGEMAAAHRGRFVSPREAP